MAWTFLKRWMPAGTPFVHDWKEVLFVACENDDAALIRRALAHGAQTTAFAGGDEGAQDVLWQGMSALGVAIQFGAWSAVAALLEGGADVHDRVLYPHNIAWAGKLGKSHTNHVPVLCLAMARLAGQTQNTGLLLDPDPSMGPDAAHDAPLTTGRSPASTLKRVVLAFLDHGADPGVTYDLVVNQGKVIIPEGTPRRPIDHLALDHPLILPHLPAPLLQRLGLLEDVPDTPLHLLTRHARQPARLMAGTVALVSAGASPYALDQTGHSALHHLAQSMDPGFFVTLLERLPEIQLHGYPDLNGFSALDTLRRSVVMQTDSDREKLDMVDVLSQRSMANAQAPLRAALAQAELEMSDPASGPVAEPVRSGRRRL